MRSLRWVGLVFSLLIVGVLGGLMAPLPSEAVAPSLTLKVDSGGTVELIQTTQSQASTGVCSSGEISAGFNLCYRLKTGTNAQATGGSPSRTYQVTGISTGATLNVADTEGGVQKFKMSTLRITPTATDWGCSQANHLANCPNALETHVITLTLTLPFDFNPDANTTFQGMLLTEGNFYPVPATTPIGHVPYTVANDTIDLSAYGKFSSSDGSGTSGRAMTGDTTTGKFYSRLTGGVTTTGLRGPLRFQYGGTASTSQYYSLAQTQANYDSNSGTANTYPIYTSCQNASFSNECAPTITAIYRMTVYGPDTIELLTSNDLFWGGCTITNNKGGQNPQGPPCFASSVNKKGLNDTLLAASAESTAANTQAAEDLGSTPGEQCVVDCPCAFEECQGTIVIGVRHTNNVKIPLAFPFQATGPDIALPPDPAYNFLVNTDKTKTGETPFENLFVGNLTAPWTFTALVESFPPISGFNGSWKVDNIDCTSELNTPAILDGNGNVITPANIVSTWTTESGPDKRSASVNKLGKGDVVKCIYHAHKNS